MENAEDFADAENNKYLSSMIRAMESDSVVKQEFGIFLTGLVSCDRVFAFEGPDDKTVYYHWVQKLRNDFTYEPYVCKNKHKALQLYDVINKDKTGFATSTYVFIDRDFDGLRGRAPGRALFMPDNYSVENYIVCEQVLQDLLKNDFHCADERIRGHAIKRFGEIYQHFLHLTSGMNYRIFSARRFKIRQIDDLPTKIGQIADIHLDRCEPGRLAASEAVKLHRELDDMEKATATEEFALLDQRKNFRGKFALLFFVKWLGLLRADRLSEASVLFAGLPKPEYAIRGDFSLASLAPLAPSPPNLGPFLQAMP